MALRIGIIGESSILERENLDWSNEDTVFHGVQAALKSTGLKIAEIDTIVQAGDDVMDGIAIQHVYTVEPAGSFLKDESKVESDGAWAVHYAIARLLSGKFNTAMVVAQSKASQCKYSAFSGMTADPFYLRPIGADGYTIGALQAQYYTQASGASETDFARVAAKNRSNGKLNPRSMSGETGDFSTDDILNSKKIATPLTELSSARAGDGCVVLILATENYIKEKQMDAAYITGVGLSSDVFYPTYRELGKLKSVEYAIAAAEKMAGFKANDVDLVELHEVFAHQELMLYEGLGLCAQGKAGDLLQSGRTSRNGDLPVNASGGALSGQIVYATGLHRLLEASLQLRGKAGDGQLKKANKALVHSQAGLAMQKNICYFLER